MIEGVTRKGLRFWTPVDTNDAGLLQIAEGATFGETIFPSGWKSPPGTQIARRGKLYEVETDTTERPDPDAEL
ncbi:hypothetical protein [Hyphomicrobium sp.]|uniref:hypothetical protein n=1 Tax=Hyphomicrobium sp. TaxID=82 RepID=UPI001DE651CB|nr:hypothetical protein [Hyphomicrobium sp.]MBY0559850.1 hypothetical protein [Hyphomicrobium sp.]